MKPQRAPTPGGVHDNYISLIPSSLPPNVYPYHQPFSQNSEIEKIVQEFLAMGCICTRTSSCFSLAVIVLKIEGFHNVICFQISNNPLDNFILQGILFEFQNTNLIKR